MPKENVQSTISQLAVWKLIGDSTAATTDDVTKNNIRSDLLAASNVSASLTSQQQTSVNNSVNNIFEAITATIKESTKGGNQNTREIAHRDSRSSVLIKNTTCEVEKRANGVIVLRYGDGAGEVRFPDGTNFQINAHGLWEQQGGSESSRYSTPLPGDPSMPYATHRIIRTIIGFPHGQINIVQNLGREVLGWRLTGSN